MSKEESKAPPFARRRMGHPKIHGEAAHLPDNQHRGKHRGAASSAPTRRGEFTGSERQNPHVQVRRMGHPAGLWTTACRSERFFAPIKGIGAQNDKQWARLFGAEGFEGIDGSGDLFHRGELARAEERRIGGDGVAPDVVVEPVEIGLHDGALRFGLGDGVAEAGVKNQA